MGCKSGPEVGLPCLRYLLLRSVAVSAFRPLPEAATAMPIHPTYAAQLHFSIISNGRETVKCSRNGVMTASATLLMTMTNVTSKGVDLVCPATRHAPRRHDATSHDHLPLLIVCLVPRQRLPRYVVCNLNLSRMLSFACR